MNVLRLSATDFSDSRIRGKVSAIGRKFIEEAGHPFPMNSEHFFNFWHQIRGLDMGEFYVVFTPEDQLIGVMGVMFAPDSFTGMPAAVESFWFVDPEHRKSGRAALKMMQAYEADAKKRGCRMIHMCHLADLNAEGLGNFYKRRGYSPAESHYRKVI